MMRNQSGKTKPSSTKWTTVTSSVSLLGEAAIASTVLSIFVYTNPSSSDIVTPGFQSSQVKQVQPSHVIALSANEQRQKTESKRRTAKSIFMIQD